MCVCLAVKPWGHLWLKLLSGFLQNKHWSCGCRTTAAFTPKLEFLRYVHQVHYCFKSELTLNPPTIYPWVWSHFHSWVLMVTWKHEWNWEAVIFTNDANTAICNNVIKKRLDILCYFYTCQSCMRVLSLSPLLLCSLLLVSSSAKAGYNAANLSSMLTQKRAHADTSFSAPLHTRGGEVTVCFSIFFLIFVTKWIHRNKCNQFDQKTRE